MGLSGNLIDVEDEPDLSSHSRPRSASSLYQNRVDGLGGALAAYGAYCSVAVAADVMVYNNSARQGGALAVLQNGSIAFDTGAIVQYNDASVNASIATVSTGGTLAFGR